jgi:hypothetical protein
MNENRPGREGLVMEGLQRMEELMMEELMMEEGLVMNTALRPAGVAVRFG